jgi:Membrane domain of glycerophosphoryl diester phosphodiesterase
VRPLNLGETLDASIKIVRARWRTLALVMVVIALPIQLANIIIISSTTDVYQAGSGSIAGDRGAETTYGDESAYVAGRTVILALGFLGYLLGTVACYRVIADAYRGREATARESLAYAGNRLGATLWLTIALVAGLTVALIALILPFVWLVVAWSVAYPVMLVEGTGGVAALKRSFKLVEGRWWATFGRLAVAYILVTVVTAIASLIFLLPAEAFVDDTSFGALVLESAANFIVSLVTTPFIAAVVSLIYFDLRGRKEGFDIAVLADRIGDDIASERGQGREGGLGREGERDAFGNPVQPPSGWSPPPSGESVPPPLWSGSPRADEPPVEAPPSRWTPPVAPDPRRPPSGDE